MEQKLENCLRFVQRSLNKYDVDGLVPREKLDALCRDKEKKAMFLTPQARHLMLTQVPGILMMAKGAREVYDMNQEERLASVEEVVTYLQKAIYVLETIKTAIETDKEAFADDCKTLGAYCHIFFDEVWPQAK